MNKPSSPLLRKIRCLFVALLSLASLTNLCAQDTAEVYGTVKDNNGITLPQATVYIQNLGLQTTTDENGNYSLQVPADTEVLLEGSFQSYSKFKQLVTVSAGERKKIKMTLKVPDLPTFTYKEDAVREDGLETIPMRIHSKIPGPQVGIESVIHSFVGVSSNNELSSGYSVRGGSFDENLIYVNDIEVYRPFLARSGQQEGLSFPNPSMVSNINFSAGGFDARFGDKMSSVLDIKYKRPEEFEGSFSAGLLGGAAHIGSRLAKGKMTQITGARYRVNQGLLRGLDEQGDYRPRFFDLQSYWTYAINDEWDVGFLGNISNNRYNFVPSTRTTQLGSINQALQLTVFFEGQEITQFETYFGALNLNYSRKDMILKFITSRFSTYESENFDIEGQYLLGELERDAGSDDFGEVVRNIGVGGYLNHARNSIDANVSNFYHKGFLNKGIHNIQWGAKFQHEEIRDRLSEWTFIDSSGYSIPHNPNGPIVLDDLISAKNSVVSNRVTGYVQNKNVWERSDTTSFRLTYGVRANYWDFNEQLVISPRARIAYDPHWDNRLVFRFATGLYYQPPFYREMRGLFGEVNPDIRAQKSTHFLLGADMLVKIWERDFKLITEAFYKKYDDLIPYEIENVRLRYYGTNNSSGFAYGVDTKLNGEFLPGVQSWASLSFLNTQEDLSDDSFVVNYNSDGEEIINGFTFNDSIVSSETFYPGSIPRPTDQRISFSMFFQDEMPLNPSYKVQLSVHYGTGLPFGPPTFERYKDVQRTPSYRRFDIGFSKVFVDQNTKFKKRPNGFWSNFEQAWISLEVFNLLQIPNVQSYLWVKDVSGRQYAVPNFLTPRTLNLKVHFEF